MLSVQPFYYLRYATLSTSIATQPAHTSLLQSYGLDKDINKLT